MGESQPAQQNKAFVLQSIQKVSFEDRPIPKLTGPQDVIVQVAWTGICGSDVHYWQHGKIGDFIVKDPMILGHESSGIVTEIGPQVTTLKVGDRVALEPGIPCRHCVACKSGKYNLCPKMAFAATPPFDGTLTKFYVLAEDFCYKLPDSMSLEAGALVEPASVAVHIVRQGQVKPGSSVVIFGAGPVGLLCAAVARNFGATKIVMVDIQEERLKFAQTWITGGVDIVIPERVPARETAEKIKQHANLPDGADIVLDASGAEPCIQAGIHVARMGGTYVQAGMGRDEITFPIAAACTKELNVRGSFRYGSGDYQLAVDFIGSGRIDVEKLVSQKYTFLEAEKAFEAVKAGKGIKMLIEGVKDESTAESTSSGLKNEPTGENTTSGGKNNLTGESPNSEVKDESTGQNPMPDVKAESAGENTISSVKNELTEGNTISGASQDKVTS